MKKALLVCLLAIILVPFACADLGPKPTADFTILYEGGPVYDAEFPAVLLSCEKETNDFHREEVPEPLKISIYDNVGDCTWQPAPMAWGGNCLGSICSFTYMIPANLRLALYLPSSNRVYISPAHERANFHSTFDAELTDEETIVLTETTAFMRSDSGKSINMFIIAFIITMLFELTVALIYLLIAKLKLRILWHVAVANAISLPIVWFGMPYVFPAALLLVFAEAFALVFEAYFLHWLNRKTLRLKKAFILSFLMNLVSFSIGGFILLLLTFLW